MKRVLKIVGILIAVILVVLIALPFIIDVNMFRPQIESGLSSALGRQVKVGNLKLSLLGGSVGADDLSIADDPGFSHEPFIRAKALNVGVELMPLILSKTLQVTGLTIDQPQVVLLHSPNGRWNFSSLGAQSASPENKTPSPKTATKTSGGDPDISVAALNIKDGSVSMAETGSPAKAHVYKNVNITVHNFSFSSKFPFTLTASLPGGGDAKVDGTAGPINPTDASMTPLEAKVSVKKLDLAASGFIDPSSGFAGLVDFDGTLASNGRQVRTSGAATAEKLKLSPKGTPAPKTVVLKYTTVYELQKEAGELAQGDVTVGKAIAKLAGTYQMQAATTILNMKLNADNMPVDDLQAMLPALGVILPSGSSLQGGTLSADLAITGPVDKLAITGPVRLTNTKLANFSLASKLSAISKFTGGGQSGSDTTIQNFSANVRSAPDGITAQNINLTAPALGVVTGNGTVSPQQVLNFTMNANLTGGALGDLTKIAGLGGKSGLPFFIQGTASDPKFVPDVKGMLNNQLGGLKGLGQGQQNPANSIMNGLGGLLGKKK
jgi:AsmA protein